MSTTKDFNSLKQKVFLAYHQDGIIDLVAGTVVFGFGLNMLTGNIAFLMVGWLFLSSSELPFRVLVLCVLNPKVKPQQKEWSRWGSGYWCCFSLWL